MILANKNFLVKKEHLLIELYFVLIPKLFNNLLGFYSLINFDFVLSETAHFDKSIILRFFSLQLLDL